MFRSRAAPPARAFPARATELFLQNKLNDLKPGQLDKCTQLLDLNIAQNWLAQLPDDVGACQKLQYLYANANRFTKLPVSFTNLTNLVRLELHNNELATLGDPVWDMMHLRRCCLSGLTNLLHLTLHANKLTQLPACLFNDLTQLKTLTLHNNQLTSLPDNIGTLTKLDGEELPLECNCLDTIPSTFFNLTQLPCLRLSNNRLTSLPEQLSTATHLKSLLLQSNLLRSVPSLEHVPLTVLDLSHNQLEHVPPGMGRHHNLGSPNLMHNCIAQLPKDFETTQAHTIHLGHNLLTWLPDMPEPRFTILDVSHNQLECLPERFPYGRVTVSVHNNRLTRLPDAAKSLHDWNLGHNQIHDPGMLLPWPDVTDLNLEHNGICRLPDNMGDFAGLQELNLDSNQLTTLPDSMGQLTQLKRLWLRNNQLTHLPSTLSSCTSLAALVVSHNPGLKELPLSFSSMIALVELICDGTGISPTVRHAILDSTRELRNATAATRATTQMRMWAATASSGKPSAFGFDPRAADMGSLTHDQRQTLSEWLHRLENTKDFRRNQAELADVVLRILHTVINDADFADQFFAQVNVNMAGCGDRAAMSLNELFTAWTLHTMDANKEREAKLALCIGVAKTNALRRLVAAMHLTSESVETYLYVESQLREALGLVTACRCMLYGASAPVNLAELTTRVNDTYDQHLFSYLEQHPGLFPDFPATLSPDVQALFDQELDVIESNFMLSGGREQDYLCALQELKLNRERTLLAARQAWLKQANN
jgi:Leucine-rich repeat (LRR) protein